jgi:hypothetical protein
LRNTFGLLDIIELDLNCVRFKISWEVSTSKGYVISSNQVEAYSWLNFGDGTVDNYVFN